MTNRVDLLKQEIEELSSVELIAFRDWFAAYDATAWDAQFEGDVVAGRLDRFAEMALTELRAGQTTEL